MRDEELKALVSNPMSLADLQVGDYVRIKDVSFASSTRAKNIGAVLRLERINVERGTFESEASPHGMLQMWKEHQIVPATCEEYVAYCESIGKVVEHHVRRRAEINFADYESF